MGLKDKASKINFGALPEPRETSAASATSPNLGTVPEMRRPKTAPGALMAFATDQRSELLKENEALRERAERADELRGRLDEALGDLRAWDGAKAARLIDARKVRRSRYANRDLRNLQTPEYEQIKAEIASAGGNIQPIKVRPVPGQGGEDSYEVVFGHRRHQACLDLGLPVLALIDSIDDRTLFVEMDRENRSRKDLSPWEQGVMYQRALNEGLFPSNRKLAEAVGADLSAVGKALSLAELPAEIVACFSSPLQLQYRWAKPLRDALAKDSVAVLNRTKNLDRATELMDDRKIFEYLLGKSRPVEPFHPRQSIEINAGGRVVGRVEFKLDGSAIIQFERDVLDEQKLSGLADALKAFLK